MNSHFVWIKGIFFGACMRDTSPTHSVGRVGLLEHHSFTLYSFIQQRLLLWSLTLNTTTGSINIKIVTRFPSQFALLKHQECTKSTKSAPTTCPHLPPCTITILQPLVNSCAFVFCLQSWELMVLSHLNWDINVLTPTDFVDFLLARCPGLEHQIGNENQLLRRHAITFMALCSTG